jgi:hypothetical protein
MAWKKINSKKYQVELDGEWTGLAVPFGKVEKIVEAFFGNGGVVDVETGTVLTSIPVLVRSFGELGDILLSDFDHAGEVKEKRSCRELSLEEVPQLFEVAVDVIQNFTAAVLNLQENMQKKDEPKASAAENKDETAA